MQRVRYKRESFGAIDVIEVQSTFNGGRTCAICGGDEGITTKLIKGDNEFFRIYICERCQKLEYFVYGFQVIYNTPREELQ